MGKLAIVLPTIGRKTLDRAIESVLNQKCDHWSLFVIYDGRDHDVTKIMGEEKYQHLSDKVFFRSCDTLGEPGLVRNAAIEKIPKEYEWVGFLDDDDTLEPEYVEWWCFRQPKSDMLIYKMLNRNHVTGDRYVIPDGYKFEYGQVGINVAIRRKLFEKHGGFKSMKELGSNEDWDLLHRLAGDPIEITFLDYLGYLVRPELDAKS